MEGDEWHAQNTRRMDLVRNASICRRFINGSCRLGPRCSYRHEWPVIPPVQLCRYFPKGGCWYGERCRYLHVLPEVVAAVAGRRGSVPTVSSSDASTPPDRRGSVPTVSSSDASTPPDRRGSVPTVSSSDAYAPPDRGSVPTVSSSDASTPPDRRGSVPTVFTSDAYTPPDRRGSKPALLQADVLSRPVYNRPQLVVNISNPPHNTGLLAADIAEEHSQDADSPVTASWELVQSSEAAQACAGRNEQETSNETMEDGAAAAAFSSRGTMEEMEAFLRSQNVTCGICMDKVYEKTDPRNHVFGILPNCNHAFCLQCIMTWRKTKDLGPDVVKSCPQCRVRSAFYVPNKHWVEGQAKESLIAAFKEKFSKRRCNYYSRYRCCPFKTECLYRHDKHAPRGSFPYYTEDEDYDGVDLINLFIAMTVLRDHNADDDDDDDVGFPFYLSEEYGV